ncbi:MAG: ABC transporter ATP-binding protein [Nitrospirota bacterium]|nr:ABC transporter ATP-binding protein [Nitrospirota bacterium]
MITLNNVAKWYPTRNGRSYVFRDVTATLPAGRHIGVLGRNGAGKSTLLRLLGGIDHPSHGHIRRQGRVSWPVGLTGGFQGSLTGRESVRFVCRINGVSDRERMREKIAFVAEFADIGDYFDEPVKHYSSGMRARLGFGLSMAFDFDYYLIDEIIAVGDPQFRLKCQDELMKRRGQSTFIVVSHNLPQLKALCQTGVIVRDGEVSVYSDIEEAIDVYQHP